MHKDFVWIDWRILRYFRSDRFWLLNYLRWNLTVCQMTLMCLFHVQIQFFYYFQDLIGFLFAFCWEILTTNSLKCCFPSQWIKISNLSPYFNGKNLRFRCVFFPLTFEFLFLKKFRFFFLLFSHISIWTIYKLSFSHVKWIVKFSSACSVTGCSLLVVFLGILYICTVLVFALWFLVEHET